MQCKYVYYVLVGARERSGKISTKLLTLGVVRGRDTEGGGMRSLIFPPFLLYVFIYIILLVAQSI